MKLIERYVGKTVITATFVVLLAVLGLQIFIQFASQLQDIGTKNYGILQVFEYVALILPKNLYQFFPIAAMIGGLLGLGRLAQNSELVVMQSAGLSKLQITGIILKSTAVLLIFITPIGEVAGPTLFKQAQEMKQKAVLGEQSPKTQYGVWLRDHSSILHIRAMKANNELDNINRYDYNDKNELIRISFADVGRYVNHHWVFQGIHETTFHHGKVQTNTYQQQTWPLHLKPSMWKSLKDTMPDDQSLIDLYRVIQYGITSGLNIDHNLYAFWRRIFQPISALVMVALAVPFIFGPLRSVNIGIRIIVGVCIGFSFYILNAFLGPLSIVYQLPPWLAASLPIMVFMFLGLSLNRFKI